MDFDIRKDNKEINLFCILDIIISWLRKTKHHNAIILIYNDRAIFQVKGITTRQEKSQSIYQQFETKHIQQVLYLTIYSLLNIESIYTMVRLIHKRIEQ